MAKGSGKSGTQIADEHVQVVIAVLERYKHKPLPRIGAELNKSALARECGIRREVFRDNPRCRLLLDDHERIDRQSFLNKLDEAACIREEKSKTETCISLLEAQVLRLSIEKAQLEQDLQRYRKRDAFMANTGKMV
jgi:hypothetical protein